MLIKSFNCIMRRYEKQEKFYFVGHKYYLQVIRNIKVGVRLNLMVKGIL